MGRRDGRRGRPRRAEVDAPRREKRGCELVVGSDLCICAQWADALVGVLARLAARAAPRRPIVIGSRRTRDGFGAMVDGARARAVFVARVDARTWMDAASRAHGSRCSLRVRARGGGAADPPPPAARGGGVVPFARAPQLTARMDGAGGCGTRAGRLISFAYPRPAAAATRRRPRLGGERSRRALPSDSDPSGHTSRSHSGSRANSSPCFSMWFLTKSRRRSLCRASWPARGRLALVPPHDSAARRTRGAPSSARRRS